MDKFHTYRRHQWSVFSNLILNGTHLMYNHERNCWWLDITWISLREVRLKLNLTEEELIILMLKI